MIELDRPVTAGAREHIVHNAPWALLALVLLAWLGWRTCGFTGCPSVARLAAYQPGGAPVLLNRTGEELARLRPVSRELVALSSLPAHVRSAFVAVEDRRFVEHGGVDWRRIAGSALANVRAGGVSEGGSTITMQLARNVFPDRLPGQERSVRRKLLEVRVAREIEDRFTKDEILELYLNHIYFGGPIYGLEAASRHYFGKGAAALELGEAALLAALPRSPNSYDPRVHPARARERRDLVLRLMAEQGFLEESAAERARARPVRVVAERPWSREAPPPAPYFVQAARRALEARLGDGLYSRPLRIHTTLDAEVQRAAERALETRLQAIERGGHGRYGGEVRYGSPNGVTEGSTRYLQGAVVVLDATTGDVLALVGGRDFADSPYDRAVRSRRPVGSAFKPFVYAAALDRGYAPSQLLVDEPLEVDLPGEERWVPRNLDGRHQGEITLREAAVRSNNVATVRLAMAVGPGAVVRAARRAGVESAMHQLPSLALGTVDLSLLELTAAYSTFATLGTMTRPRLVRLVEDGEGKTVWSPRVVARGTLDEGVAYLVTDLLRDAVDRGTGRAVRRAGWDGPAAGKTGTTDAGHDVWFVGYTPELVAGVWIGFDRPRPVLVDATAGELAAPVWGEMMRAIHAGGRPRPEPWPLPGSVVERPVDPASGLVLAEGCHPERGSHVDEVFLKSDVPATTCPAGEALRRGILARLAGGVRSVVGGVGGWLAGLFQDDEAAAELARQRREEDRYLGRSRLPRAGEAAPAAVPDPVPLGVPLDSIPLDSIPFDSIPLDSLPGLQGLPVEPPELEPGDTIIIIPSPPDEEGVNPPGGRGPPFPPAGRRGGRTGRGPPGAGR